MAQLSSFLVGALLTIIPMSAQMILQPAGKSVPQAKTREELDAFGMILDAGSPQSVLAMAARFRRLFAKSEFYEYACVAEMQAAMDVSDMRLTQETASVVLSINPNNPEALLTLAEVNLPGLAGDVGADAARQERAVNYARAALDRLHALSLPPLSDSHTWLKTKRSMLARAHLVLAEVAIRRGQLETAKNELQTAVDLSPSSKAYLLLSRIYRQTGREDQALTAAKKAQSLAPAPVVGKGNEEIKALESGGLLR
jgi:tetratricopeptide (TPR) repeat protein